MPFLTPGNLPDPGTEPISLASPALTGGFFTTESPGKPLFKHICLEIALNLQKKKIQETTVYTNHFRGSGYHS